MSRNGDLPNGKEGGSGGHGGFLGLMDDLKEKLSESKLHEELHDAKVALIHKKHQIGKFGNL
ncbi:hypothetical protein E4U53_007584, partial [Claviceps sorghi]